MKGWEISEDKFEKDKIQVNETLFHTANGYLGVRANYEEGVAEGVPSTRGCYINGFYETYKIQYNRKNPGDPEFSESIMNLTDAQTIELWLDDEKFSLFEGTILSYERKLDMKNGIVTRSIDWQSPKKKRIQLVIKRLASFVQKELFIINYSVKSINFHGNIRFTSTLFNSILSDLKALTTSGKVDLRAGYGAKAFLSTQKVFAEGDIGCMVSKTKNSNLDLSCCVFHRLKKCEKQAVEIKENEIVFRYQIPIVSGEEIELDKYVVYADSRRHQNVLNDSQKIMTQANDKPFAFHVQQQQKYLKDFWQYADVTIEGDYSQQSALRFSLYQLLQSAGKDGLSNVSAKGLSATGYEGHYWWDTEMYMIPFFLFTHPEIAKSLLLFRYNTLTAAKRRARELSHPKGALFPWRTISGPECGQYYPLSTASYHINPDIAYAVMLYYLVTDDLDFLADYGAEIIFETARVMFDVGNFRADGQFVINVVTGPEEHSLLINNNYYTNIMSKFQFKTCQEVWNILKTKKVQALDKLMKKIGIEESEIHGFKKAADHMYLPFDKHLQICAQDESFLQKKIWDFKNTPKENFPLFLNYHPLVLNRYQVCKQADTVLAHMLREEETTLDVIRNSYYYYEKITTHDSSLSHSIFSIMAARISDIEKAFNYFQQTSRLDLDDIHHNTYYGIHTACMGGTWMCCTYGFAGLRIINDHLHLRPLLPKEWNKLEFTLYFKKRRLSISVTQNGLTVKLLEGKPLIIYINDKQAKIDFEEVFENKKLAS